MPPWLINGVSSLFYCVLLFQIYLHCNKGKDEVSMLVAAKTSGATPLVIACRNGHYDVAEYLIEKCNADIEQPGSGMYIRASVVTDFVSIEVE